MPRFPSTSELALVAVTILLTACARPEPPPHVFLISIDTLRADHLSPLGFETGRTPTAARLADGGTLFTHAVTPMGITVPVHTTMLTGRMPRDHGVRANVHRLGEDVPGIAEVFAAAGYDTASILSFGAMNFMAGLDRGFGHASDRDEAGREFVRPDAETLELALDWIGDQDGSTPLFMLLHFYDVHSPHLPTPHSDRVLDDYDGPLVDGVSVETLYDPARPLLDRPEDLAALRAFYAGEAIEADRKVGAFLDALKTRGLLENSVVVLVSDHGQGLGENGYFGHGPTLEQTVIHVPIIIHDFRREQPSRRINETVGLIDLAPTLLGLAGLELPGLVGRDLLAETPADGEPPLYIAEVEQRSSQTEFRPAEYDEQALAAYFGHYRFVEIDGTQTLYRIAPDDAQALEPVPLDTLHESLRIWLEDTLDAYRENGTTAERAALDNEAIEALKSLGYIQ